MRRSTIAALVLLLSGCEPIGIPGEEGIGFADTPRLCITCDNLPRFARGGRYEVLVSVTDEACGSDWDVGSSGVVTDVTSEPFDAGWSFCSRVARFSTPVAGAFALEVTGEGHSTIDRIALSVEEPDELLIVSDPAYPFSRIDPDRVVIPVGAYVSLSAIARHELAPLALDTSRVTFTTEGDAIIDGSGHGWPVTEPTTGSIDVGGVALGTGVVRAQLEGVTAELPIDVVPLDAVEPPGAWCPASSGSERCDGVDNDCDDAIDEEATCSLVGASTACEAGRCVMIGCLPNRADCDGAPGCETELDRDPASCGACGNACFEGELCVDGECALP